MKTINLTKILPKNDTTLSAVISLIFGIILFIVIYMPSKDLLLSGICAIGTTAFSFLLFILIEIFGKKRHYSILESRGFQELISRGFRIEEVNEYKGIFGTYDGYLFDIYYDWSTYVKHKVYKAVVFNVYFVPPSLKSGKTDYAKLKALSEKYDISYWSFKSYNFWWREGKIIMNNSAGIFNPSFKKLTNRMQIVLDILRKENLKPLDKQTLDKWRKAFPMSNIPEIEVYCKEKNNH